MKPELKKAFRKTITRWEKIVEDVSYYARSECALCAYDSDEYRKLTGSDDIVVTCHICPIHEKTGSPCGGTPWADFRRNPTTENALRELVFLKDLYIELLGKEIELIDCPKPEVERWWWIDADGKKQYGKKRAKEEWCSETKHTKPQVEWVDITKEIKWEYLASCLWGRYGEHIILKGGTNGIFLTNGSISLGCYRIKPFEISLGVQNFAVYKKEMK